MIAKRLGVRPQHVKPYLERLLELGRFELVQGETTSQNGLQPTLFPSFSTVPQDAGRSQVEGESRSSSSTAEVTTSAQPSRAAAQDASAVLAQTRSREERPIRQRTRENAARELDPQVDRLVRIAKISNENSIATIARHAKGLPDSAIVNITESYLAAQPKPRNPAGWIVRSLQRQHADRQVEPEPPLDFEAS